MTATRPETATMRALYLAGWTLGRIAATYGVTRQAVSQRLALTPDERERALAVRQALRGAAPEGTPLDPSRLCAVCEQPLPAGFPERARTHGGRCSELWSIARRRLDDDVRRAHRIGNALSVLRHADDRNPAQVRSAWRFLAGLTRGRRPGQRSDSKTTRAVRRAGQLRRVA